MDAEKVVVELIANTQGFDSAVVKTTSNFESGVKKIEQSATKAEGSLTKLQAGLQGLIDKGKISDQSRKASTVLYERETQKIRDQTVAITGLGGAMSGPNSPFVVPPKLQPAVSRSFSFIQAGAAALGGVIGGILTTAVLSYVASLAEMILKSDDASTKIADMVEKLKDQARESHLGRAAQIEFSKSIEGVTAALDDNEDALKRIAQAGQGAAYQAAVNAEKARLNAVEVRKETVALFENAQAQLERAKAQAIAFPGRDSRAGVLDIEARLKTLQSKLGVAQAELTRAENQFTQAMSRAAVERGSETELEGIKRKYDKLVESTRRRLLAEGAVSNEIVRQTAALREQQRVEEEKARAAKRADHSNDQAGRQINEAQARAIVASIGGTVTSGTRTAKHNEDVGGVPNSFHVKGQALDIAKTAGLTLGKIVKAFEAKGVHLIEKLDEGDHFHIAFGKRGRSGPSQETLAKRAAAAALEAERREQAFISEKGGLDQQVIDARQVLVLSAQEIAKLELEAIEKARVQYNEKLASLVEQNKISGGTKGLLASEAAELQKLNDERAKLRADLVKRREDERRFRLQEADAKRAVESQLGSKQVQQDLLQSQVGLADTAKQRRELEGKLLALQFEMERIQAEAIIAEYERLRIKQDLTEAERQELADKKLQADLARERLGTLGARESNANQQNAETNASPLQSFFGDIPGTADEINEALESIAAGGLATFTDALTDAIVNWRGFGDVAVQTLRSVAAGIIRLGIQQLLLQTIGKALGTAAVATTAAQAGATAAAWAPAAAAASLATLGANAGPAAAALASTHALSAALSIPKGFRSGGYTGDGPVGSAAGIVHGKEFVFDADATRRIGPTNLEAIRRGVTPSNAAAVAPRGAGGGFGPGSMDQLSGILREAIEAMPPIQLFPTYDPVAAFEQALGSPRGRKRMLEFMGNNRQAVTGTLQP